MKYVKSCGAVVFTRNDSEILYLIICQNNGDYGFPKGHMDEGEDEYATTFREIREEIGLTVQIVEGFRKETTYPFPNNPNLVKQVVYFLAEYADQKIICQPEEVAGAYLLPYEEASEMLSFPETKAILREANNFLIHK